MSQGVGIVPTSRGLGCGLSHEYEVMGSGPGLPVTEPTLHTHRDSCLCGCDQETNYIRSLDIGLSVQVCIMLSIYLVWCR